MSAQQTQSKRKKGVAVQASPLVSEASTQSDISLPQRVPAVWNCRVLDDVIVDRPDSDVDIDNIEDQSVKKTMTIEVLQKLRQMLAEQEVMSANNDPRRQVTHDGGPPHLHRHQGPAIEGIDSLEVDIVDVPKASPIPRQDVADTFGVEGSGTPTSDTSNDMVQEDAGPRHLHRGRGQSLNGRDVIWRENDVWFDFDRLDIDEIDSDTESVDEDGDTIPAGAWSSDDEDLPVKAKEEKPRTPKSKERRERDREKLRQCHVRVRDHIAKFEGFDVGKQASAWTSWTSVMSPAMFEVWKKATSDDGDGKPCDRSLLASIVPGDESRPLHPLGDDQHKPKTAVASRRVGTRRLRLARGITMDSGAHDNVIPRRMVRGRGNRIRPSAASRSGVHYVSATSHRIPNEGETDLRFKSKEGTALSWTFQVAEVNKVLAAVSALVDTNHRVVFDKDEKSGEDVS